MGHKTFQNCRHQKQQSAVTPESDGNCRISAISNLVKRLSVRLRQTSKLWILNFATAIQENFVFHHANAHHRFLRQIKKNFEIRTVFDIGAYHGEYTKMALKYFPKAQFHLFDINPFLENRRLQNNLQFHNVLLSDKNQLVDFFQTMGTGDSYYVEDSPHYSRVKPNRVKSITLDELMTNLQGEWLQPQLIKLDTQGSELDILRGASKMLGDVLAIVCEIPVSVYNRNSPTFQDYLNFFDAMQFIPVEILEVHKNQGRIVQLDMGFVHKNAVLQYRD